MVNVQYSLEFGCKVNPMNEYVTNRTTDILLMIYFSKYVQHFKSWTCFLPEGRFHCTLHLLNNVLFFHLWSPWHSCLQMGCVWARLSHFFDLRTCSQLYTSVRGQRTLKLFKIEFMIHRICFTHHCSKNHVRPIFSPF